jgi:hypothetical protein
MPARTIGEWVASGRLHVVHRGVYAVGHPLTTEDGTFMAAVLASGPGAVLSHLAAARHWRIAQSDRVEVTTPRQRPPLSGVIRHRAAIPGDEVTRVRDVPTTIVPRTLLDIAPKISAPRLAAALAQAQRLRLHDRLSLPDLLARYPRRAGTAAIRALLDDHDPPVTRSELELLFLEFLAARGFPRPLVNHWMPVGDRWIEADCAWPEQRLIVELDGSAHESAFHDDRVRDEDLLAHGWHTMRVTYRRLTREGDELAANLRRILTP